jgi:hypothetical protein
MAWSPEGRGEMMVTKTCLKCTGLNRLARLYGIMVPGPAALPTSGSDAPWHIR